MIKELSAGLIIYRRVSCMDHSIEYLLLQKEQNNSNKSSKVTSTMHATSQHQHDMQQHVAHWTFPKGHLDHGETDIEAAIRETKEEAGLLEEDFQLINDFKIESSYISRKGISKTVLYWIAEINNPNVKINLSNSHKQYKWLKLEDALALVKYDSMKSGLIKANEFLINRKFSSKQQQVV